ncbi:MAG: exodeoxyribonuclease VII large subunit [Oscillospiraceae bacterium]|nr:exodeoxyribonuclease VII large subunit [Oscillospiraceae bacterium]
MSILSVSQLNRYVAFLLKEDAHLRSVLLRGEIANFTRNFRSGHCYFSLRDAEASVKAVMFRSNADRLRYQPENGMHVIVQGTVTLYERDGAYQIIITDMQPDGIGAQALALQQRREKLAKLGYFAPEHKRPLPPMPQKIGIVTSRSGAALQDMLQILRRRYPIGRVCIYPALVQGEQAPASIADALRTAGSDGCDVILMGRGGGSNEDLSAFQSEEVAHAVYHSPVPVVSAVGHETDHCIADEVADLRAPTPSAAAELSVPDLSELRQQLQKLSARLDFAANAALQSKAHALTELVFRLERQSLRGRIAAQETALHVQTHRLHDAVRAVLRQNEQKWTLTAEKLEAVSPVAILRRGYALVYRADGLVRSAGAVQPGDRLSIRLAEGSITAEVRDICTNDIDQTGAPS